MTRDILLRLSATEGLALDPAETISLADLRNPHALRCIRGNRLIVAGAPPQSEVGFPLVPLLAVGAGAAAVELLDIDSGNRAAYSKTAVLGRYGGSAAASLALSASAVGWQAFVAEALRRWPSSKAGTPSDRLRSVCYLRPIVGASTGAGGSVSHTHGIIRALRRSGVEVAAWTTDAAIAAAASADPDPPCDWNYVRPVALFRAAPASAAAAGDVTIVRRALADARGTDVIYQRHARFSVSGAVLARLARRPLFLEYNGSESFVARYWQPTPLRSVLAACEAATIRTATRIFVVSRPIREELLERGVPPHRIVVTPNGVDPDLFDRGGGDEIRRRLGIDGAEILAGFVGTFGPWHGAPVLADAFTRVPADASLRLLFVGDGPEAGQVRRILQSAGALDRARLVGQIPPHDVPAYLDACDLLVSPHVPMPNGDEFFGSPTKLYEYMAAGKAIVASRLGQIGEVLDDETAVLVTPGDAGELAAAMVRVAADAPLRRRLGNAAQAAARERHTWDQAGDRIQVEYDALAAGEVPA